MFQLACEMSEKTVLPIANLSVLDSGEVNYSIGAGMVINKEGYFVTAGHVMRPVNPSKEQHLTLTSRRSSKGHRRRKKVAQNKVLRNIAVFGQTAAFISKKPFVDDVIDLAVGKLENYPVSSETMFPKFRNGEVRPGELLCRVGFPFVDQKAVITHTVNGNEHEIQVDNLFPIPLFVNEALVSRFVDHDLQNPGTKLWIETSSPGLPGQSGGPLSDADGIVCGIQVNTISYPLGFSGGAKNQSLYVGRAVHVSTIRSILDDLKIEYDE